jgi:hypothetical protein
VLRKRSKNHRRSILPVLKNIEDDVENGRICQEIATWLSPVDYGPYQTYLKDIAQKGTGESLFSSQEFTKWIDPGLPWQTLHLRGAPGAGKTITVSALIHRLQCQFSRVPQVGITFIYCGYDRWYERRSIDLLLNLLKQFVIMGKNVPHNVKRLYDLCRTRKAPPAYDEVFQVLCAIAAEYTTVFFIIDGLNESEMGNIDAKMFMESLSSLQTNAGIKVLLTGPFDWNIKLNCKDVLSVDLYCEDDDIEQYFSTYMSSFLQSTSLAVDVQQQIKAAMKEVVDGK